MIVAVGLNHLDAEKRLWTKPIRHRNTDNLKRRGRILYD
jgi:hypothetical protein